MSYIRRGDFNFRAIVKPSVESGCGITLCYAQLLGRGEATILLAVKLNFPLRNGKIPAGGFSSVNRSWLLRSSFEVNVPTPPPNSRYSSCFKYEYLNFRNKTTHTHTCIHYVGY